MEDAQPGKKKTTQAYNCYSALPEKLSQVTEEQRRLLHVSTPGKPAGPVLGKEEAGRWAQSKRAAVMRLLTRRQGHPSPRWTERVLGARAPAPDTARGSARPADTQRTRRRACAGKRRAWL